MSKIFKSLLVAGAMVTGVFASAKDVNVNNAVALEKTEQTAKVAKTVAEDDGAICVGSSTTIVGVGNGRVVVIHIEEVVCVVF